MIITGGYNDIINPHQHNDNLLINVF